MVFACGGHDFAIPLDRAREILGVRQDWLGFVDSGWPEGDPKPPLPEGCFALVPVEEAAEPLVRLIREFKPHVMTTYDEKGGYPHPDHVMCHQVSVEAFEAAGDPTRYPDAGEPWQPLKLYYHHSFHRDRTQALHDEMIMRGLTSPYEERLSTWAPDPEHAMAYLPVTAPAHVAGDLAELAARNGWAGIVVDGCVRDRDELAACAVGIRALGLCPMPPAKRGQGQRDVPVRQRRARNPSQRIEAPRRSGHVTLRNLMPGSSRSGHQMPARHTASLTRPAAAASSLRSRPRTAQHPAPPPGGSPARAASSAGRSAGATSADAAADSVVDSALATTAWISPRRAR